MKAIKKLTVILTAAILMALPAGNVFAAETVQYLDDSTASDYVGITIDGNYSDWDDKPHSKIQYGWDTSNNYHSGALYRDADYVYLHVRMSPTSYTKFNGSDYHFIVDGQDIAVAVVTPEGESIHAGNTNLIVRNQNGYTLIPQSSGVLTTTSGEPDEWEIKIPLSFFSSSPETIRSIEFYTSNLGPQHLIATGTSTAPYALAGLGFAAAAGGILTTGKFRQKKFLRGKKKQGKQLALTVNERT